MPRCNLRMGLLLRRLRRAARLYCLLPRLVLHYRLMCGMDMTKDIWRVLVAHFPFPFFFGGFPVASAWPVLAWHIFTALDTPYFGFSF